MTSFAKTWLESMWSVACLCLVLGACSSTDPRQHERQADQEIAKYLRNELPDIPQFALEEAKTQSFAEMESSFHESEGESEVVAHDNFQPASSLAQQQGPVDIQQVEDPEPREFESRVASPPVESRVEAVPAVVVEDENTEEELREISVAIWDEQQLQEQELSSILGLNGLENHSLAEVLDYSDFEDETEFSPSEEQQPDLLEGEESALARDVAVKSEAEAPELASQEEANLVEEREVHPVNPQRGLSEIREEVGDLSLCKIEKVESVGGKKIMQIVCDEKMQVAKRALVEDISQEKLPFNKAIFEQEEAFDFLKEMGRINQAALKGRKVATKEEQLAGAHEGVEKQKRISGI